MCSFCYPKYSSNSYYFSRIWEYKPKLLLASEKFVDLLIKYCGIKEIIPQPAADINFKILKKTKSEIIISSQKEKYKLKFLDKINEGYNLYLAKTILLKIKLGVPFDHIVNTHKVVIERIKW